MPGLRTSLRALDPQLPRTVWLLEAGTLVNFFGSGIAFPFLLIYLHNVRGIGLGTAGLVVAAMGVVGVAIGPLAGPILDLVGGRVTLAGALVVSAVSYGCLPLVHHAWEGFVCASGIGLGTGVFWPAVSVLLVGLTDPRKRHHAFAVQRVAVNLGIGLGGLVGGLIATSSNATSFTILFLVDAATFVAMIGVLPFVPEERLGADDVPHGGYRATLRDRALVSVLALNVVFIAAGYAPLELLPVFAKNHNGVSEKWIGLIFFVNTSALVLAQLPVARLIEGRRRMRALAVMPIMFACVWLIVLAGGAWLESTRAALLFTAAAGIFGFATCFHGPTQAALVADLAPPRLRGRYMALSATSWEAGFVLGPAGGGWILQAEPLALWPVAAALCACAAVATISVERVLPRDLRRTPG